MTTTASSVREIIRGIVVDAVHEARDSGGTIYTSGELAADRIVERLDDLFAGQDLSAAWIERVQACRPVDQGPTVLSLARQLEMDETTPVALRAIAASYLRSKVGDRPRSRDTDPETSRAAAEKIRAGVRRPGGTAHRVLDAYRQHARATADADLFPVTWATRYPCGMTAREVEERFTIPEAHKRTSDLLRDQCLEVVTYVEDVDPVTGDPGPIPRDLTRNGGRVLRLTLFGRQELDRLNEIAPMISLEG